MSPDKILLKIKDEKYGIITILLLFVFFLSFSWGKYGLLNTYDIQREIMVPYLLTKGFILYKDIFYFYGPLMPYFLASLIKIFGYSLNVFYVYGLFYTLIYSFLLYFLARRITNTFGATMVSVLFLSQLAFFDLGTYVLPYSYSATAGVFLVSALVFILLIYFEKQNNMMLYLATFIVAVSFFIKQDYMISCFLIFLTGLFLVPFTRLSLKTNNSIYEKVREYFKVLNLKDIIKYVALIFLPVTIIYLIFSFYTGGEDLFNGLYPIGSMKSLHWSLVTSELGAELTIKNLIHFIFWGCSSFVMIIFIILIFYFLMMINQFLFNKLDKKVIYVIVLFYSLIVLLFSLNIYNNQSILSYLLDWIISNIKYPYIGINLWLLVYLIYLIFYNRDNDRCKYIFLVLAAFLLDYRMFFNLKLFIYSFFYLPLSVLLFVYLIKDKIPSLIPEAEKFSKKNWQIASGCFLILFSLSYIYLDTSLFMLTKYKVNSPIGTFYARYKDEQGKYLLIQKAARYVKNLTSLDDRILALPYISMVYPYANRLPVSKYYYCPPGTFYSKELDEAFIEELRMKKPQYILISSDMYFDQYINPLPWDIYSNGKFRLRFPEWIKANYKVDKIFETPLKSGKNWTIWVYKLTD